MDHTFVIPVYGDSPHLEACIVSLKAQRFGGSRIILTTSTPSTYIEDIANRHKLPLKINERRQNIAADWNFAMAHVETGWVTVAHQDDLYDADYLDALFKVVGRHDRVLLGFTDYLEIAEGKVRKVNRTLAVKRMLCRHAFGGDEVLRTDKKKLALLKWGNPICCPSVMLHRTLLPDFMFPDRFEINLDWDAWSILASHTGDFLYVPQPLIYRRIHAASETSSGIADERRLREDRIMFAQFWNPVMAAVISTVYRASYGTNRAG